MDQRILDQASRVYRGTALGVLIALAFSASVRAQDAGTLFKEALRRDMEGGARAAETAFELYRRAAEAGHPEAQFNVAVMLDTGRGVSANVGEAATWYARAASHGVRRAAYNLGQLYEAGQGVPRNLDVARAWFEGSKLPAARRRLASMAPEGRRTGVLSAPSLISPPADATLPLGSGVELVWTSRPQPEPVWFYVELRSETASDTGEVFSGFVTTTSVSVPLHGPGAYTWRVFSVARAAGRYAVDSAKFRLEALP